MHNLVDMTNMEIGYQFGILSTLTQRKTFILVEQISLQSWTIHQLLRFFLKTVDDSVDTIYTVHWKEMFDSVPMLNSGQHITYSWKTKWNKIE